MNKNENDLFRFIAKPEVKTQLQNDLDELHTCMKQGALKASVVLIGGLVECVLYYHIESVDDIKNAIPRFDQREIGLSDLLQWARQYGIIDESLFRLSEPIRDYRNLIHPRVQIRTKTLLSENLVQIGYNVLLEIIHNVNKHHTLVNGQKADAIVSKKVKEICNRPPTKADIQIYTPILEKYGFQRGELILERTLLASIRKKRK